MSLLLLVGLLASSPAESPPPAGGLEGQPVAAVRVESPEAARLARYVELEAGEAYSAARVRRAVELLYATGMFADVPVEARPTPAGVEVVFRPVPAPFFLAARIEGDRVLAPSQVQRIARLREGEPLWSARLERAAQEVALELARQGYLEAQVTASAAPAANGADAVFAVRSGPRAQVGAVRLEGASGAGSALPRPGEVYRRERAQRAAEQVRRRLVAQGRWRARVEPREAYDPGTARVSLTFVVEPGPQVSVEFRGAGPPRGVRRKVLALLRDGGVKPDLVEEAGDRLEEAFLARGYRGVLVTHHEEARARGTVVVFEIEAGPPARVASVRVEGAPAGLALQPATRPDTPLVDRRLEEDAGALARALEAQGYSQARVEVETGEGGGDLPVVFRVRAGPRTVVAAVAVETPAPLEASPELRARAGRPYRAVDLAKDRDDVLAAYRNAGYLQAEVTPEAAFSPDRSEVRLALKVVPGQRTEVEHIVISRLPHTREATVRHELEVEEGQPLGLQKVLESQRRLGALGIFQRVSITEIDPESVGKRSLVVQAEEAPRTTVAYGLGYAERDLLRASVEVTRRNLSGLDRSLSTFVRASFRGNRALATYREPHLFGGRQELFVTGFREEEDRETFDFIRYGGLLQTARRLGTRTSLILRYVYQQTSVFDVQVPLEEVDRQFRDSTVSGPSASIVDDTRDDPLDPRRGRFVGLDVQFSHRALGGDGFVKGFLQGSGFLRMEPRLTLAGNLRLGLARTLGSGVPARLPLPDRFFAGGDYSLRGFKLDTVGPLEVGTSGELFPTGGNALLLGSAELRLDLSRELSVAGFSDVGNVFPLVSDVDLGDLRVTAGLGMRYRTALGPVRLDWGYKLNRRPGEAPYRVHFTVGHAF